MSGTLPPLTALRAFEAAARHMSFSKAAEELSVTPAALSYQIKSLEAHLGKALFKRRNRAVDLTEAGRTLLPGVSEGFQSLQTAWQDARRSGTAIRIFVAADPALISQWLWPRMHRLHIAHPDIELCLLARSDQDQPPAAEVDVDIRFESAKPDQALLQDWVIPVCHPSLEIQRIEDILGHTLLREATAPHGMPSWSDWFHAAGHQESHTTSDISLPIAEALPRTLSGEGILLARASLVEAPLRQGMLQAPFAIRVELKLPLSLHLRANANAANAISRFTAWIKNESHSMATLWPDLIDGNLPHRMRQVGEETEITSGR